MLAQRRMVMGIVESSFACYPSVSECGSSILDSGAECRSAAFLLVVEVLQLTNSSRELRVFVPLIESCPKDCACF